MIRFFLKFSLLAQVPQDPIYLESSQVPSHPLKLQTNQLNCPDGVGPDLNLLRASWIKKDIIVDLVLQGGTVLEYTNMPQHLGELVISKGS